MVQERVEVCEGREVDGRVGGDSVGLVGVGSEAEGEDLEKVYQLSCVDVCLGVGAEGAGSKGVKSKSYARLSLSSYRRA